MNLKELQDKSDRTKKRIIIGVAIVLILLFGIWWFKSTRQHLQEVKQEGVKVNFPVSK